MIQVALIEPKELVGSAMYTKRDHWSVTGGRLAAALAVPFCKKTVYGPLKPGTFGEMISLSWRPDGKSTNSALSQPGMLFLSTSGFNSALNPSGRDDLTFWVAAIAIVEVSS